ncbi:MAG: ribonuclease Y [Candidatus Omnitrophota bacterium]|jgi:ribonuclease Y
MSTTSILTFLAFSIIFGSAFYILGYFVRKKVGERKIRSAEIRAEEIRVSAQRDMARKKAEMQKEADKYLLRLKQEFDEKHEIRQRELEEWSGRIREREGDIEEKMQFIQERDTKLKKQEEQSAKIHKDIEVDKESLTQLIKEENTRLQKVSGLAIEEAKRQLLRRMEVEVRAEASKMIKAVDDEAKSLADKKAKNIVAQAIQKCAAEQSIESTVSVVQLPSEEMKGRIIGKEGRNVRTFEQATGVDVIIDDTPGAVVLSAFDPVRREIARLALEQLIEDGRIHPSSIEETVGKVRKALDESIKQEGEEAILALDIGDMDSELIQLVGRLKYRTSYGQNSLNHAKEVAGMMNVIAGELGIDPIIAKRAGLLHDIGKAVTSEVEGPHALIGGELARRYGEPEEVIHAIEAHHEDIAPKGILPILVQAADAISGARPGARRDTLDNYIKRLENLERIAIAIPGVERVFAIQAGREIRILVNPNEVSDEQMPALAREVSTSVKENMHFPGKIRVTVVRETRATDFVTSK